MGLVLFFGVLVDFLAVDLVVGDDVVVDVVGVVVFVANSCDVVVVSVVSVSFFIVIRIFFLGVCFFVIPA